jgi:hypothetical protein
MNSSTKSRHYNTEHRTSVEHEIKAKQNPKQNKTRPIKPTRVKRKERNKKGTRSAKKGLAPKWRLKEIERETDRDTEREREKHLGSDQEVVIGHKAVGPFAHPLRLLQKNRP